ncbi:MAG: hypothetical protein EHM34_00170 [Nitrosopumilales archaeon]|nr:MAG: hypothetical protein EHM34_00170 [Nitrosopumilales archaeon]
MNIVYISLPKYLNDALFSSIANEAVFHRNIYLDTNEEPKKHLFSTVHKMGFDDLVELDKYLIESIDYYIHHDPLKNIIKVLKLKQRLANNIDSLLKELKPDAIITTSDMGGVATRLINDWAYKNKVSFFVIQPCFIDTPGYSLKQKITASIRYILCNKLLNLPVERHQFVYGCERSSNYLLLWNDDFASQIKNKRVIDHTLIVGNHVFDRCIDNKVKITVGKPTVLLCTQPYSRLIDMGLLKPGQDVLLRQELVDVVTQNPLIKFIVKVHPSENKESYFEMFSGLTNCEIIGKEKPFTEVLKRCDVQVSMASYTSFEAVIEGIPIILMHPDFLSFFDQFGSDVELRTNDIGDLNLAINTCLQPWYRKSFAASREIYIQKKLAFFGDSAEMVVHVIKELSKCKKRKLWQ